MTMLKRILSVLLIYMLIVGMLPMITTVSAESTTYQLATLLTEGKIKPLSRTAVNPDNTGIMCDWPGNGFSMNVSGAGGTMSVQVETNYAANWVVLVDGEQVYRERLPEAGGTISAGIPAGEHTVMVVKESDNLGKETNFCDLTTMAFDGTIEAKPADKALTIEFIGDSYTCGHGTLGKFAPGVDWTGEQHSFTHGYAYYTAQNLNADYMIAARGGIGLFDGVSAEQPDDDPKATIADIYPYTGGFRKSAGLYDFARKADIVVVELGANDSIKESDANFTSAMWRAALESLTDTVREKYPDAAIVYMSHRAQKFAIMKNVCEDRAATDPNLYYFSFAHQGTGSGGATQYYGHPDALDSKRLADGLSAFLVERGLTGKKATAADPTYTDYTYFASASGNDSNDGKTLATAKLTLTGALAQAKADRTYATGERIVVNVEGTVDIKPGSSQYLAQVGDIMLPDGSDVPILVQTNDYSGTKAVLDTNHSPSDSGSCMVWFCNSMTLKDITFQSTTNESKGTRDYQLYAGYNHIVFDNVTFATAGSAPTASGVKASWYISAAHAIASVQIPEDGQTTITFKNGDYTNVTANAVYRSSLYQSENSITNAPAIHAKVIIDDGAQMKNLYNRWGELGVGSSTVEVRGGTVATYYGTVNSTSANYSNFIGDINFVMSGGAVNKYIGTYNGTKDVHKTIEGNVNFTKSGGLITGTGFCVVGNYADVAGDVNVNITGGDIASDEFNVVRQYCTVSGAVSNTISGGIIEIRPTASYQAINLGARSDSTLGSVTNNISGGMFLITFNTASINSGFYLGSQSSTTISGRVTNNISGGSFVPMNGAATAGHSAIYLGTLSGKLKGGIYNNITGGTFDVSNAGGGGIVLGSYSANMYCAKIVNVIGDKETGKGPMFLGKAVYMAGTNASIGVDAVPAAMPDVSVCSDTVVVSNTIYGGYFDAGAYCGPYEADTSSKFNFVKGSIETTVYDGMSKGTFYGAGSADVYGKVTLNLYGGVLSNIYTAGNAATVYDGVELNISEGFREYHDTNKTNEWHFWGGTYGASIPVPQTQGRDSLKITVSAENSAALVLKTPIEARCRSSYTIDGPISVSVSGGTYPEGFSITGTTVNGALAENYVCVDTSTGTLLKFADTDTTTGETSVTVIHKDDVKEPVIPEEYIATVQNGQVTAYVNSVPEMIAAVSKSGESIVTLYEDINYTKAIAFPYSCTIDFNGHTVRTNPTSGNGIEIAAIGSKNATTTVKNGTLHHYTLGVRVGAGAVVVDNMNIISASGAPIGIYDPNGDYKSINCITGSFLSSKSYHCIAFNSSGVDFTNTGITVEDSVLVSHKSGGVGVVGTKGTGGTVTVGKDVKIYTYLNKIYAGTTVVNGETLTQTTGETVMVDGTEYTGMNLWSSPISENVVIDLATGKQFESIAEAVAELQSTGGTIRLTKDVKENSVDVWENIVLDLNGHTVETKYFTCYGNVCENGDGGEALLKVSNRIHIAGEDSYLPIYDSADGGYRFYKYELVNLGAKEVEGNSNAIKFGFRLVLNNSDGYTTLAGTLDEQIDMRCALSWTGFSGSIDYGFTDTTLKAYAAAVADDFASAGSTKKALTLTVSGLQTLDSGDILSMMPSMNTLTGVKALSTSSQWQVQ